MNKIHKLSKLFNKFAAWPPMDEWLKCKRCKKPENPYHEEEFICYTCLQEMEEEVKEKQKKQNAKSTNVPWIRISNSLFGATNECKQVVQELIFFFKHKVSDEDLNNLIMYKQGVNSAAKIHLDNLKPNDINEFKQLLDFVFGAGAFVIGDVWLGSSTNEEKNVLRTTTKDIKAFISKNSGSDLFIFATGKTFNLLSKDDVYP